LWDAVDVNLIQRSFKCYGISNKCDGTENDWIFNYDHLGQGNKPSDEVEIPSDEPENEEDEEEKDEEYVDEEGKRMRNMLTRRGKRMRIMLMRKGKKKKREDMKRKRIDMIMNIMVTMNKKTNYVNFWDD
jgi:hypothetical protein